MIRYAISAMIISTLVASVYAGCMPCGCNPDGVATAGDKIVIYDLPTTATFNMCCNEPHILTPEEAASTLGLNPHAYDWDKYDQDYWVLSGKGTEDDPCTCTLSHSSVKQWDPHLVLSWEGDDIDLCKPGMYTIKAVYKNDKVTTTTNGGLKCTSFQGNTCKTTAWCTDECNATFKEEESVDIPVEVLPPTSCGGCMPQSVEWICNTYVPSPDGFTFPSGGSGTFTFSNGHWFSFLAKGYPFGSGMYATEDLTIKRSVKIYPQSNPNNTFINQTQYMHPDGNYVRDEPSTYSSTGIIRCLSIPDICQDNKAVVDDAWGATTTVVPAMYEGLASKYGVTQMTTEWKWEWINQEIYVGGKKMQGGPFSGSVTFTYNTDASVSPPNSSVYSGTKSGNI